MNDRERFVKVAKGELPGELFLPYNLNYAWFMDETLERWRTEGLPPDAEPREHFGLERVGFLGGGVYTPMPAFEERVLAEDEQTRTIVDGSGVTLRVFKSHADSKMPQWLDYPIKSRADWEAFKCRLDPTTPARYPANWDATAAELDARDYPLGYAPGSFFGHTLQRWVGTERLCMWFYDEPALVQEMLEHLEHFFLTMAQEYVTRISFDFASFGEDIAFKGKPFISPAMFRRFIQPSYGRICDVMRANGIEVVFVDSDGDVTELIPLWLEMGINGFSPLEVAAGMDALTLKREYGDAIVLAGAIDKRALAAGPEATDREIAKVRALVAQGGYFPAVDHSVPPDVPYDSFCYLVERLRETVRGGSA